MSLAPNRVGSSIPERIDDQRSTGSTSPGRALVRGIACLSLGLMACSSIAATEADYAPIVAKALSSTLIDVELTDGRLIAVGERGHVLYSTDKGETWTQGKMPFRRMLTGVDFVDAHHGWAVGHQSAIFHTDDGGETWVRQLDGYTHQQKYNEENLVRTRDAYEALSAELEANPDPSRDLDLEDAMFAFEDAEFALEDPPLPTNFHDVWFMDKSTGWAVGAFGRMSETRDGGKTWTDKSHLVRTFDGFHLNSVTGTKEGEVFITGEGGVVFRSLDAGATWEQLDSGYFGTFFNVTYDQVNNVIRLAGLGAALYQSLDKGETWEEMQSPVPMTFAGGSVGVDGNTVLAGPGGMIAVIDGATHYIKAHPQPGRKNYSSVVALGEGNYVAVGQGGPKRFEIK